MTNALTPNHQRMAVAGLIDDIDRDAPNIRWLLSRKRDLTMSDSVETTLGELEAAGLARPVEGSPRFRITEAGRDWLGNAKAWEFQVNESHLVSQEESDWEIDRYRVTGVVRQGVLSAGDWFSSSRQPGTGVVVAIESSGGHTTVQRQAVICVDGRSLEAGEILRRFDMAEPA